MLERLLDGCQHVWADGGLFSRWGGDEPPRNATSAMEYTRTRAMSNVCLMCLMDALLFLPCAKVDGLDTYARFWMFGLTRLPGGLRNRLSAGLCHIVVARIRPSELFLKS